MFCYTLLGWKLNWRDDEVSSKFGPHVASGLNVFAPHSAQSRSASLVLSVVHHTDVEGWAIVFVCSLPMCFFFVGNVISELQA